MSEAQKLITAEEFDKIPEPDDHWLELVKGVVIDKPFKGRYAGVFDRVRECVDSVPIAWFIVADSKQ